ncbi:MAG TPA: ABC transporter substrate-binding protein [Candidatus Binatus sp.]|nr:ABC transporter substrate-binding protein [Candidatus Binatus sp.]
MNKKFWLRWTDSFSDNRKSKTGPTDHKPRGRELVGIVAAIMTLATGGAAVESQQPRTIPLGFLSANSRGAMSARTEAFRQGLRELGYVEKQNVFIEYQYAEGKLDRLPALAAELVRLKVAVIVTEGTTATRFAKQATSTIPIVMAQDPDPVGTGFVVSLARPGGNITGLSNLRPELSGKRLELLKEIVPKLSRVAVFGTSTVPGHAQSLKETELAAGAVGTKIQYLDVGGLKDIETVFRTASTARVDAVLALGSPFLLSNRTQVIDLAIKNRLPAIYYSTEFVEDGGLMSYGVNIPDLFRRAATYVDKILKGAKPADLPVEQPMKFELVINLNAAKQIGVAIPPNVLARADKVIR